MARRTGRRATRGPDPLARYSAKRNFQQTPEPAAGAAGGAAEQAAQPRFVIHEHHARRLHWDLRLEHDGVLASWAIPKGLPQEPRENRFAAATEDHPLEYLDFAGEIPKGQYGAGTISIWDRGTYECLKWEPRKVEVALHGERARGRYALFAIDDGDEPRDWMIHRMDPPADPTREPMPRHLAPMLARAGTLPDDDGSWAYEIKWDGVRALAYSQPRELTLESRNRKAVTDRYPELGALNRVLGSHEAILDGEIVAFDERDRPSFETLQRRMNLASGAQARRLASTRPVTYMIFDLLWLDGHSLMELPYVERRARLSELGLAGERWQTPEHLLAGGAALLKASAEQGLEGIVAKRLSSTYTPGLRTAAWIKVKTAARQEFVVGGWLPGKGRRRESIGALLLGVHERDGSLRYVGRVGSGLADQELQHLQRLLSKLERPDSPFGVGAAPPREAVYCDPRLVVEVRFTEWTAGGNLRHPTYLGLREDKAPEEVVREAPSSEAPAGDLASLAARRGEELRIAEGRGARRRASVGARELVLSNLDKVLYPHTGFDKRALIDYYAAVSPTLLGHLQGRPLTVTRWPDGVEGKSFFQKQAPAHRPDWVKTATVASSQKPIDYVLAEDLPTLVWLANLAAIELHAPLARADTPQRPTALVFDLDPGPPAGILECGRVALRLRGMFENLGLRCFAKTSGAKGLQVYLPLNDAAITYAETKPFAKAVAELLERDEPELVVSRMSKARRTGRVLIDWSQNDARKTTISVYSLRASDRPRVSTPLDWSEIEAALAAGEPETLAFEAARVLERVLERGDLFAPLLSLVQKLPRF
ncbi:MAG TPA: DNA ligase D [Solirubrobacteraceae bacterium]|nr:DNA ligase D [Solirubrobacteraceae bacterium]